MTPREKARIRNNFRTFRDLPADRRQQLRDRYRNMTPDKKCGIVCAGGSK